MTATEHGILFQGEMVRAILDGRKDVTRRASARWAKRKPGDRLWVRETWQCAAVPPSPGRELWYRADVEGGGQPAHLSEPDWRWRPSIHMPRWASRIALEVVSITLEDAVSCLLEAPLSTACPHCPACLYTWGCIPLPAVTDGEARREGVADRGAYLALWRRINGWEIMPGVIWRVEFRRVA